MNNSTTREMKAGIKGLLELRSFLGFRFNLLLLLPLSMLSAFNYTNTLKTIVKSFGCLKYFLICNQNHCCIAGRLPFHIRHFP